MKNLGLHLYAWLVAAGFVYLEVTGAIIAGQEGTPPGLHRIVASAVATLVIGFVLFTAGPMIASAVLAFTEYDISFAPKFTGLANFRQLFSADAYVVCLSSYTPRLLAPLGIHVPVYPAKGYSATLPIVDMAAAPSVSVTDDAKKIVFTRMGNRLRAAGTAELSGYNLDLNVVRCEALTRRASEWFGGAIDPTRAEYWTGLRPATPSNVPYVGRTRRYSNLWANTGHGTLGWTLAAGSGKRIADMIRAGEGPTVA